MDLSLTSHQPTYWAGLYLVIFSRDWSSAGARLCLALPKQSVIIGTALPHGGFNNTPRSHDLLLDGDDLVLDGDGLVLVDDDFVLGEDDLVLDGDDLVLCDDDLGDNDLVLQLGGWEMLQYILASVSTTY